jgi:tetratricopeptide (TPR) repeat protein
MAMNTIKQVIIGAALAAIASCGGGGGKVVKAGTPPPPPDIKKSHDITQADAKPEPKREVSKDAKADYKAALESFNNTDKSGWNESACRGSADKFQSVVREHAELVEAAFMVGLSYERCGLLGDAEKAYTDASRMKGDPTKLALSLSSLGTLYYKSGKLDAAKQYWDSAIKANGKLVGARINVASMELEQMRKIGNPKDPNWKKLEEDARFNLSNVLGVESDSYEAYTNYGLVYMEGWKTNKNRLDLAKTLLDEAKKRNEKYAPLQNAYGLYWMHKGALNEAAKAFALAAELDPKFVEARVNAGLLTLGFRKYDTAKELFAKAVELAPKNYDAVIGLGFASRGMGDLDGAEAAYKKAIGIDSKRGDAYFNLGVLYKGFRATKTGDDLKGSINMYRQAKDFFQQFIDKGGDPGDIAEAKENIKDCDKVTKQLEDYMKVLANQPPPPVAPPTPAPAPAPAPGTPPAGAAPATPAAPAPPAKK